jgi:hypothetical protein
MSPEKTRELFERYPSLYRGKDAPPEDSSMSIGFECGDGWFALIDRLSQAIEDIAATEKIRPYSEDWPEAVQVKQEAGTLRFHLRHTSATLVNLINEAAKASMHTCEVCGRDDATAFHYRRFTKILCLAHANPQA